MGDQPGGGVRKRHHIAMVLAGFVLLSAGPALAEIYYRIDENGIAHFTNTPTTPQHRLLQPEVLPSTSRLTAANMSELIEALAAEYELDDRKSTRLNSSHHSISYAVFCLKK